MPCLLVIDVGTASVKAGLFDTSNGAWRGFASRPIQTRYTGLRAEQHADEYWSAAQAAVGELRELHPADMGRVAGLTVTGQMRSLVLVDSHGWPVAPVFTLHDRRAREQAEEFIHQFGIEAIHGITGQRFTAASTPAKLRWLCRHRPDVLRATRWLLAPKDYLRLCMTGTPATDPIDASGWILRDLNRAAWHDDLVRFTGISTGQLPPILPACSIAGVLLPEVAAAWGVPADAVVAIGGGDDIAATGCGACRPGDVYEHIGSTGSIFAVCDRPVFDPLCIIECYPTERSGVYWVGGSCNGAGAAIEHALARSGSACDGCIDWQAVETALAHWSDEPPDRRPLYLPFVAGERCPVWSDDIRGAWVGLSVEHTREQMAVAAHEGTACLLAWILRELDRLRVPIEAVHSAGRGGEDESYGGLRATIYGRGVHRLNQPDAALFGAVLIAGVVTGQVESIAAGLEQWSWTHWLALPDERHSDAYRRRMEEFCRWTRMLSGAG